MEDAEELYNLIDDRTTKFLSWGKGDSYKVTEDNILDSIKGCEEGSSWNAILRSKED